MKNREVVEQFRILLTGFGSGYYVQTQNFYEKYVGKETRWRTCCTEDWVGDKDFPKRRTRPTIFATIDDARNCIEMLIETLFSKYYDRFPFLIEEDLIGIHQDGDGASGKIKKNKPSFY